MTRYVCTQPGSTLLVAGAAYTVKDHDEGLDLYEFVELPGFLFGLWRFAPPLPG